MRKAVGLALHIRLEAFPVRPAADHHKLACVAVIPPDLQVRNPGASSTKWARPRKALTTSCARPGATRSLAIDTYTEPIVRASACSTKAIASVLPQAAPTHSCPPV